MKNFEGGCFGGPEADDLAFRPAVGRGQKMLKFRFFERVKLAPFSCTLV